MSGIRRLLRSIEDEVEKIVERKALEILVDQFAAAMKLKLISAMKDNEPYRWQADDWTIADLKARVETQLNRKNVDGRDTGDPIDVANFALFWWDRMDNNSEIN